MIQLPAEFGQIRTNPGTSTIDQSISVTSVSSTLLLTSPTPIHSVISGLLVGCQVEFVYTTELQLQENPQTISNIPLHLTLNSHPTPEEPTGPASCSPDNR
jgi:hypothetical protein